MDVPASNCLLALVMKHDESSRLGSVRDILTDIFGTDRRLRGIFPAFRSSLPKLLANIVQFASCVCPIAIVVSSHEDLLSPSENIIGNIHGCKQFTGNWPGRDEGLS